MAATAIHLPEGDKQTISANAAASTSAPSNTAAPVASTSTRIPSKLNPNSAAFSFLQPDLIASTSVHHAYPPNMIASPPFYPRQDLNGHAGGTSAYPTMQSYSPEMSYEFTRQLQNASTSWNTSRGGTGWHSHGPQHPHQYQPLPSFYSGPMSPGSYYPMQSPPLQQFPHGGAPHSAHSGPTMDSARNGVHSPPMNMSGVGSGPLQPQSSLLPAFEQGSSSAVSSMNLGDPPAASASTSTSTSSSLNRYRILVIPPPDADASGSSTPSTSQPARTARTRRYHPPTPSEAPALSYAPNVRPPPGASFPPGTEPQIPKAVPKIDKAYQIAPEGLNSDLHPIPDSNEFNADLKLPTPHRSPTPIPQKLSNTAIVSKLLDTPVSAVDVANASITATAASSIHSSPLLTPMSPATTTTSVDLEDPMALLNKIATPSNSNGALPSTPKSPKAVPATLKKSWADLVRSPNGTSSPIASNGSSPISALSPHGQRRALIGSAHPSPSSSLHLPPIKKTLAQTLEGVESLFIPANIVPRGLINNGNLCFANSILQVLVYCSPFWNLLELIRRATGGDLSGKTPSMDAMIMFLEEFRSSSKVEVVTRHRSRSSSSFPPPDTFIPPAASDWSDPFVPEAVYESIKNNKRFDAMRQGHQEDAEEFLGFLLDTLSEEILATIDRFDKRKEVGTPTGAQSENGYEERGAQNHADKEVDDGVDDWMEVGSKGKTATTRITGMRDSPITKIFGGQLRSVLRCSGQKDSITLEPYQRLQLDIQPDHVRTIEDALANLTLPEPLPDFVARNGLRVEATKQVLLETFPPVLILHLKRFLYDNVGGVQKSGKIVGYGTDLEIGPDIIAPSKRSGKPVRYQLFGVVYHHGKSASGGHYTVAVRQQLNSSSWIHIDDTAIRPISAGEVAVSAKETTGRWSGSYVGEEKGAYLLLYSRIP